MDDEEAESILAFIASRPLTLSTEIFGIDPRTEFSFLSSQHDERIGREVSRKIASWLDQKSV